jgi:alkanal monooxygenase alpha chain
MGDSKIMTNNGMTWGILLATARPANLTEAEVFDHVLRYALAAESYEYDTAWLMEHHFTDYAIAPDTLTMAGFLLGATSRLRIGTAVTVAPFIHPVRLAESVALLDHLGKGRFNLGLGRGICKEDFSVFGVDPNDSHNLMYEAADIMLRAWKEDSIKNNGLFSFPETRVLPKPRSSELTVYAAAESASSVEWAANNGFPLLMQLITDYQELAARLELYNSCAEAAGYDPNSIDHTIVCLGHISESRERAKAEIFGFLEWWNDESSRIGFDDNDLKRLPGYRYHLNRIEQWVLEGKDTASFIDEWLDLNPVGSPEDCIRQLNKIVTVTGVRHVALGLEAAGNPNVTERNIRRFAQEVFPNVRQLTEERDGNEKTS